MTTKPIPIIKHKQKKKEAAIVWIDIVPMMYASVMTVESAQALVQACTRQSMVMEQEQQPSNSTQDVVFLQSKFALAGIKQQQQHNHGDQDMADSLLF